jgi:hypothetical protein
MLTRRRLLGILGIAAAAPAALLRAFPGERSAKVYPVNLDGGPLGRSLEPMSFNKGRLIREIHQAARDLVRAARREPSKDWSWCGEVKTLGCPCSEPTLDGHGKSASTAHFRAFEELTALLAACERHLPPGIELYSVPWGYGRRQLAFTLMNGYHKQTGILLFYLLAPQRQNGPGVPRDISKRPNLLVRA